jgi:hypothetical protein
LRHVFFLGSSPGSGRARGRAARHVRPVASASSGRGTVAASRTGRTIVVTWRAPHGADLLGFDVYRADGPRRVRINSRVIADTSLFGGAYRFVDANAPVKATRYWVQAVRLQGERAWLGSVAAERAFQ